MRISARLLTIVMTLLFMSALGTYLSYYNRSLDQGDVRVTSLGWKQSLEGVELDEDDICSGCIQGRCMLDMEVDIGILRLKEVMADFVRNEIHCVIIDNDVDLYKTYGSYWGVTNTPFSGRITAEASISHEIKVCCGLITPGSIKDVSGVWDDFYQACDTGQIQPKCI